ncbi:MAG: T9SS type A sorting domain-containing protein, partial [Lutibacter sp.]
IKVSDGTLTNALEGIDYPQFPSIGSDGNIYFTLTRDSWLAMYNPNVSTSVNNWSENSSVKIGISEGQWSSGGSSNNLTIKVGSTLSFSGNISSNINNGTVHGWIRIPENLLSVNLSELYTPCYTSEHPTPGIFKLPEITYKVETGSCLISSVVLRGHVGQRWPMQNIGTCNESPSAGFSEEPIAYLIYFSWNTSDRVNTILAPSYSDSANTLTIMKGSEPAWIYAGSPWSSSGQSWLNAGKYLTTPNNTSWAEKDLGAFSGKSKYIYIMWHKNGPYRPDAARYRVYDYTEDKYNGIVNQTLHADNLEHGNDTFSGWYLLGSKKINITPSTKIRISQDAPVDPAFEFMQSDAILLSDYPIVDNTSLGSATNFESNPTLSVGSSGPTGVGSHWGMQGLGYQYSITDSKSFAAKLDPNIFTDLLDEDYYVEVSWDYLNTDNVNVTNAKYSIKGIETNDVINQNREAANQGGSYVGGNSIGSWSGFYRLDGKHNHTTADPIIISGIYDNAQYGGKRFVYDMVRFIPKSVELSLSSTSLKIKSNEFNDNYERQIYNYPNPFQSETTLSYTIKNSGIVLIKVYNNSGICISKLVNKFHDKGSYIIKFDSHNLAAGFYFCVLTSNGNTVSNKMIITK